MNFNLKWLSYACIFLLQSQAAIAKGGGLVGNGAGFAEQNIHYAYNILPQTIRFCLSGDQCGLSEAQKNLAEKIAQAILMFPDSSKKFEFISENERPNFFDLADNEPHRLAKTFANGQGPIYFNADVLQSIEVTSRFTTAQAAAIVAHEMGHQVGELNHRVLDDLGAKLRRRLEASAITQSLPIEDHLIDMTILQLPQPRPIVELLLYVGGQSYNLSAQLRESIFCLDKNSYLLGIELKSPSWYSLVSTESGYQAGFSSWVRVSCVRVQNHKATETFIEHKTLRSKIDLNLNEGAFRILKSPYFEVEEGIQSLK
jgi:hypothetical protein